MEKIAGEPTLIVITGPTASGKTAVAIETAKSLGAEIVSADSRQIFKEIPIGTAAPSTEELAAVPHHFIASESLHAYYSAAIFEEKVLALLPELFKKSPHNTAILAGGSMMYVDAVVHGIDDMPTVSDENRNHATALFTNGGLQKLRLELLELDPVYYRKVDLNNHKRLIHALEIIYQSGQPYSSLLTGATKPRPFRTLKFALDIDRETLFTRINARVDQMIQQGLEEEARAVYNLRHLNSLNTVGYKELFDFFDGKTDRATAIERIKKNTRVFAKKQLTWLHKDPSVRWVSPENALEEILAAL